MSWIGPHHHEHGALWSLPAMEAPNLLHPVVAHVRRLPQQGDHLVKEILRRVLDDFGNRPLMQRP